MDHIDIALKDLREDTKQKGLLFKEHLDFNFDVVFMKGNYFASCGQDFSARVWDKRK